MERDLKLVYIGRLSKEDGLFELLQDLRDALAHGVKAELVIAGSGPEEQRLRKCAAGLGLAGVVSFVGPAFGAQRRKLLAEADLQLGNYLRHSAG